jgi:hypothetical protein
MTIGSHDTTESKIVVGADGTTFVGPDAVNLFRATALWSALRLCAKTGMIPNRAWTKTAMLNMATEYTGQKYRRGQFGKASEDVKLWIDAMKAAIPIEQSRLTGQNAIDAGRDHAQDHRKNWEG